ncbi:MotE family protein [Tateyamaria armeniaca]|uniref:MotE family protein n=1 Tax=Tateyamaria armeniaca TaxID=2518930 RepID=A0ABW8URX6_9RHOB
MMGSRKKKSRRSNGRGSILLISSLLIGSAAVRLGIGAGTAVAEGEFANQLLLPTAGNEADSSSPSPDRAAVGSLLDALIARENRIAEKEDKLKVRAKALDVAQVEIERRLEALKLAEERLSATLAQAQTAAEDDLARLTTVYENMKPKEAAALFEAMEPEFAAGFLARMRPDIAAKIMSGLDPQAAYSISAILAGRNALAPKT